VSTVGVLFAALFLLSTGSALAEEASDAKERARRSQRRGDLPAAIRAWRSHLIEKPDDDESRFALARALAHHKAYEEALTELRTIVRRHPKDVEVRAFLARVLAWMRRYDDARREADDVLRLSPRARDAHIVAADVRSWGGQPLKAIPHYLIALEVEEEPALRKRLVHALLAAGLHALAVEHARRVTVQLPKDAAARELLRSAEDLAMSSRFEFAASAFEAGKVHPWWRLQAYLQLGLSDRWKLGLGGEHLWRDFQPRGAPAATFPPPGFVRDTSFFVDATYHRPRGLGAFFFVGGSPQAVFSPRLSFEGSLSHYVGKGIVLGAGYKGLGYEGQWGHLLLPTMIWFFGAHHLTVRYFLAIVQPYDSALSELHGRPVSGDTQLGHAALVRLAGDLRQTLGYFVGVAGGLAFVTASLGPTTNPSISVFAGIDLRPLVRHGIRVEYEYMNEQLGSGARFGVSWHALRVGYYTRF
jgi:tetratricopeptide (TPR) repeat protein